MRCVNKVAIRKFVVAVRSDTADAGHSHPSADQRDRDSCESCHVSWLAKQQEAEHHPPANAIKQATVPQTDGRCKGPRFTRLSNLVGRRTIVHDDSDVMSFG